MRSRFGDGSVEAIDDIGGLGVSSVPGINSSDIWVYLVCDPDVNLIVHTLIIQYVNK